MSQAIVQTSPRPERHARVDLGFIRRSAIVGSAQIAARTLGILFSFTVAKLYSPADFGEVRYLMAFAAVLVIPTLALPRTLSRFVALYRPAGQVLVDRYYSNSVVLLAIGMATVLATASVASLLLGDLDPGLLALCVGMSIFTIYFEVLRSVERFTAMALFYVTANIVQLAVVLGAAALHLYSVTLVVAAFGLSCVPPLIAIEVYRRSPVHFHPRAVARTVFSELGLFSLPVLAAHAAYTAWYAGDLLVVQHYLGLAAGGNYALTKTVTLAFTFLPQATSTAVLSRFVHAETENGSSYLRGMLLATGMTSFLLLGTLALFGGTALDLVFHDKYAGATITLLPVGLGMALYSLYLVLETWVVSRGHPMINAVSMAAMAAVTLGADVILVPAYGQSGAGAGCILGATAGLASMLIGIGRVRRASSATASQ